MRNAPNLKVERCRIAGPRDMNAGAFLVPFKNFTLTCIACSKILVERWGRAQAAFREHADWL